MTLVVNLFGGPGSGKSTTAAATFAELKYQGIEAELVTEYAKDKVWEKSIRVLSNQPYMLGKQFHRMWILQDEVDVVVTDSPLFLCVEYGSGWGHTFQDYVVELHNKFENINYFLRRPADYNLKGRMQDHKQAKILDVNIEWQLQDREIPYTTLPCERGTPQLIVKDVLERLK